MLRILIFVILAFVALPVTPAWAEAGAETPAEEQISEWICPMHCDGLTFDHAGDCPVCGMHLVPHKKMTGVAADAEDGGFFDPEMVASAEVVVPKPQRALMPGLSSVHFYVGAALLTLLTLLLGFGLPQPDVGSRRTAQRWRYPRLELTRITRLAKSRWFQPALQLPVLLAFLLVIFAGLFGNPDPARNIAPVLTWNIWWMGLIFFAFFAGEIWCTVCPWMAIPDWLTRAAGAIRKEAPLSLRRPWPKQLKNLYLAIFGFLAVTWLELAYEAPYRPDLTAWMAISMVVGAGVTLVVFEKNSFCRWVCPVGRVTGQYGTTGMLEIRRKDTATCHRCTNKDCLHGNERGLPCPTSEFMGAMNENTYCTMCTECIKSCPHDNVAINVRTPLADLMGPHRRRVEEAWFLLMILGITVFHGLAMIPLWTHDIVPPAREWIEKTTGFDVGYLVVFTVGMVAFLAALVGVYAIFCAGIRAASGNIAYRFRDFFVAHAYDILPLALAYHLAHNSLHFFYEGSKLVRLLSDPFGWGWNLFGTADWPLTMLVPMEILWIAQVVLVLSGQVAAVFITRRTLYRMLGNRRQAQRAFVVAAVLLMLLSFASLWLLNQPMEMRTA
ncbi:MAG: heavy metal-binding domain-containing protein [bacterium]